MFLGRPGLCRSKAYDTRIPSNLLLVFFTVVFVEVFSCRPLDVLSRLRTVDLSSVLAPSSFKDNLFSSLGMNSSSPESEAVVFLLQKTSCLRALSRQVAGAGAGAGAVSWLCTWWRKGAGAGAVNWLRVLRA